MVAEDGYVDPSPTKASKPQAPDVALPSNGTIFNTCRRAIPFVLKLIWNRAVPGADANPTQEEAPNAVLVRQDPRYARYFRMLDMGVPAPAVKMKMTSEGVDPDLLDKPDHAAPPMTSAEQQALVPVEAESSESESDMQF